MRYAGLLSRSVATLIDAAILVPFGFLLSWALSFHGALGLAMPGLLGPVYRVWFHARSGQTPGKRLASIRVVNVRGERISWRQSALRSSVDMAFGIAQAVAMVIVLSQLGDAAANLGWLDQSKLVEEQGPAWSKYLRIAWQAWGVSELVFLIFTAQRRALHDFIAGTVVVYEPMEAPTREQPFVGST